MRGLEDCFGRVEVGVLCICCGGHGTASMAGTRTCKKSASCSPRRETATGGHKKDRSRRDCATSLACVPVPRIKMGCTDTRFSRQ